MNEMIYVELTAATDYKDLIFEYFDMEKTFSHKK